MKPFLFFLLSIGFTSVVFAQKTISEVLQTYNSGSIPYISVEELRRLQFNEAVTVLDAREKEEYSVSFIPDAQFIGYSEFAMDKLPSFPKKTKEKIVVYCTLGVRSETIAEKLKKAGYQNVYNLYGGIISWKNKGYPIVTIQGTETDSVHTASKFWGQWLTQGIKVYE